MEEDRFLEELMKLTRAEVLSSRAFALCWDCPDQGTRADRTHALQLRATNPMDSSPLPGWGLALERFQEARANAWEAYKADKEGFLEQALSGGLWESAAVLTARTLPAIHYVVEGLLPQGLTILASPPKYGKSWLMLDLCVQTARGGQLLGRRCSRSSCLYLALEDSPRRLQDRLCKLLAGQPCPPGFYYQTSSPGIGEGLLANIELFAQRHPDCRLVVIDTLQKVRTNADRTAGGAYAADYRDAGALKELADRLGLCLVLVHHLRKMEDTSDPFNRIAGTNGLSGAADTNIVLARASRQDVETAFHLTGRDVEEQHLAIRFNKERFRWEVMGDAADLETQRLAAAYEENLWVQTIRRGVDQAPDHRWQATAVGLMKGCAALYGRCPADTPQAAGRQLEALFPLLLERDCIQHTSRYSSGSRVHIFRRLSEEEALFGPSAGGSGGSGESGESGGSGESDT